MNRQRVEERKERSERTRRWKKPCFVIFWVNMYGPAWAGATVIPDLYFSGRSRADSVLYFLTSLAGFFCWSRRISSLALEYV